MKNNQVVTRWLEGKSGKSDNGNLRTDGLDLYSYDMLIGGTNHDGAKLVLCAYGVTPTTTEHVNEALYSRNEDHPITAISAVDGDGLKLATMKVFPHDVLVTLTGHEYDPPSVPAPEPERDKATDYHPGARVRITATISDAPYKVTGAITSVRRSPDHANTDLDIQIDAEYGGGYIETTVNPASGEIIPVLGVKETGRVIVTKTDYTRVVFRVWNNEDGSYGDEGNGVIALFPEIAGDVNPATCESFEHVGQHGSADLWHVMRSTRRASKGEYLPLLRELERDYGYRLKVMVKPNLRHYYTVRKAQLRAALP